MSERKAHPTDYPCLLCHAAPGQPCKRPSDHTVPFGEVHAGRNQEYLFFHGSAVGLDDRGKTEIDVAEAARPQERLF